jgi:hypothetical protein
MARPIEATPVLAGKDAKRLQREPTNMCTPEEARSRIAWAKKSLAELTRAKFAKRRASP